jgi:hypothetical protein
MQVPEIVTVSDARTRLSRILSALDDAGPAAEPVLIGAHRKAQGVLLSVEAYENLTSRAARLDAVTSVGGSLAAERLTPTAASDTDAAAYVSGTLTAEEMADRAIARHTPTAQRRAG